MIEEYGKCAICGKIFEFAELEEHDGLCYDDYKSQLLSEFDKGIEQADKECLL
jgi:hypothetical protein